MSFFNMFRLPYLDADDGVNLGGGEPAPVPEPAPEPTPEPQGGNEPEPAPEPPKIKVKYNHQDLELPYEEAVQHIQKGMNYDKAVERAKQEARQEARDAWVAEQGYEWKGKPIKTEAEYRKAVEEKQLEDKIRSQYSNVPDEIVNELLESRRFREETLAEKKTWQEKEAKEKDYTDFDEWYTKTYGKSAAPEDIPKEVWEAVEKGIPLKNAYIEYDYGNLRGKLQQVEQGQQTQAANQKNADSSTGSVKTAGKTGGFISQDEFNANKSDTNWVRKNLSTIEESRRHW